VASRGALNLVNNGANHRCQPHQLRGSSSRCISGMKARSPAGDPSASTSRRWVEGRA